MIASERFYLFISSITNEDDDPYNCSTECETDDDDHFSADDDNDHTKNVIHKLKGRFFVLYRHRSEYIFIL